MSTKGLKPPSLPLIYSWRKLSRILLNGTVMLPIKTLLEIVFQWPWPIFYQGHDIIFVHSGGFCYLIPERKQLGWALPWPCLELFTTDVYLDVWHIYVPYHDLAWNCLPLTFTYLFGTHIAYQDFAWNCIPLTWPVTMLIYI